MEGFSECRLAPRVWCLCVCAWSREVPMLGSPWPRRGTGGPSKEGRQDPCSPSHPLAQSVVLETGPQPSPSTATFAPASTSLRRPAHPQQKLPSRENLCQLWSREVGPRLPPPQCPVPHPERRSSSGCGPYLTPSSLPVLQPAPLSSLYTSRAFVCCLPLPPFYRAFALRGRGAPHSQLPLQLSFDTKKEGF